MAEKKKKREAKALKAAAFQAQMESQYADDGTDAIDRAQGMTPLEDCTNDAKPCQSLTDDNMGIQLDSWLELQLTRRVLTDQLVDRLTDALAERRVTGRECFETLITGAAFEKRKPTSEAVRAKVGALANKGHFKGLLSG